MKDLDFKEFPEENIKFDSIVVLLHGIGADASDLLPLAEHWSQKLKKTKFYSIDAPNPYKQAPFGREWFGLEDRDQTRILKEIDILKPIIISFLKNKLKEHKLDFKNLIMVGFSQGTMVSLNLAISMNKEIRGVLGYSGGIVLSKSGKIEINSKPKICLVHGTNDDVVPIRMMDSSKTFLEENNIEVESNAIDNLGHGINQKGLEIGENFLVKYLLKC